MKIKEVKKVVIEFLKELFNTDAEIIKIARQDEGGWVCEGVIYEDSSFIKALGLKTKVQDRHVYVVKLDNELEVVSYERKTENSDEE